MPSELYLVTLLTTPRAIISVLPAPSFPTEVSPLFQRSSSALHTFLTCGRNRRLPAASRDRVADHSHHQRDQDAPRPDQYFRGVRLRSSITYPRNSRVVRDTVAHSITKCASQQSTAHSISISYPATDPSSRSAHVEQFVHIPIGI